MGIGLIPTVTQLMYHNAWNEQYKSSKGNYTAYLQIYIYLLKLELINSKLDRLKGPLQHKEGKGNTYGKETKQLHSSTVHTMLGISEVQLAVFVLQQDFII